MNWDWRGEGGGGGCDVMCDLKLECSGSNSKKGDIFGEWNMGLK